MQVEWCAGRQDQILTESVWLVVQCMLVSTGKGCGHPWEAGVQEWRGVLVICTPLRLTSQ